MDNQDKIYKRIGEFVVAFQYLENKLREIGWFILDPERKNWPPMQLRDLSNYQLVEEVKPLVITALSQCRLNPSHEENLKKSFLDCVENLHELRKVRNKILHSAFIELKAGGEVMGILQSDPILSTDDQSGEPSFDQEILSDKSFEEEFVKMAEVAQFLNTCSLQLIHRYPIKTTPNSGS